jgi:hypothetical protein
MAIYRSKKSSDNPDKIGLPEGAVSLIDGLPLFLDAGDKQRVTLVELRIIAITLLIVDIPASKKNSWGQLASNEAIRNNTHQRGW